MQLNDYPHFDLTEDGRLCSTHYPGFPRVLYDTLICLGYDGDAPVYRCRLSRVHDLDRCEVSVMIPFEATGPWSGSVIGSEPDTGIEMMTHIAFTSLCEDRLTGSSALPIALLPIRDQENPVWQQRFSAVSDFRVRAVPVQLVAQHRQGSHTSAYASDGVQGECYCRHWRD
jgi:hypothetical protein